MNFPEYFTVSKGRAIVVDKRHTLKTLGFECDVPSQCHLKFSIDKALFRDKISGQKEFYGYNFQINYIETLIKNENRESTLDELYFGVKHFITFEELLVFLDVYCLLELSSDDASKIIKEFEYLINTLLPRDFSDLYKYVGMEYRECYVIFFEVARKRCYPPCLFGIENKIKERIADNETLEKIYCSTCITKQDLFEAVSNIIRKGNFGRIAINRLMIERHLFSKRKLYKKDAVYAGIKVDFAVYEGTNIEKIIVYDAVTHLYFSETIHGSQERFNELKLQDAKLSKYCNDNGIELICLEDFYFVDGRCEILRYKNCTEIIEKNNEYRLFKRRVEASAISNRREIESSEICGCLFCESKFSSKEITQWEEESAVCPVCEMVSVIGDAQGYDITREFLKYCSEDLPILP